MARTVVTLNSKQYVTDGVQRETIAEFSPSYRTTGTQKRSDRTGVSRHSFTFDKGLGVETFDFNNPDHYGRYYDSATCDTRFPGQVTPSLLINTATGPEEEIAEDTVSIGAMENYKSNLYGLAKYVDTSAGNHDCTLYKFDPDHATTQWDLVTTIWDAGADLDTVAIGDLKRHGAYLFASFFVYDAGAAPAVYAHKVYETTANAGNIWSAKVTGLPAAAVNDQTNHILSFGTTLLLTLWDDSAGEVLVYKSTDNGANWAKVCSIASAGPSLGMASWVNHDGDDVPWIRLRESFGWIDLTNSVYQRMVDVPTESATAKGIMVWNADLYVPSQEGMKQCYYSGSELRVESMGLTNKGAIAPLWSIGPATAMTRTDSWLIAAQAGQDASHYAHNSAWDGSAWHRIICRAVVNQRIVAIAVSDADDNLVRLHYAVRTATDTTTMFYLDYLLDNPIHLEGTMKFNTPDDLTTVKFGGDEPETNGIAYRLEIRADDLEDAVAYISVYYGINGEAPTTNTLGTFNASNTAFDFASGVGVAFKTIQFYLSFVRAAADKTKRVVLRDMVLYYKKKPARRQAYIFVIDLEETHRLDMTRTAEDIVSQLETDMDTQTLLALEFGRMTATKVELIEFGAVEAVAPGIGSYRPLERSGLIQVRCEEPL